VIDLSQRKRGLVLVTGPTGSGKSTTLAAIIEKINSTRESHVITLEDPIEYLHQHKKSMVNQREVGEDTESYAMGLRAALRQDPDVIMV
jgi:twitching motility protein PilT